jgi:drug/metabolite transporter (DMT)-like permease
MTRSAPVLGALAAALLFAAGNNLQRHAAAADAHAKAGPLRLFLRLLITPRWLLGGVLALVALVFHARALTAGGVILVQSVIATTLVFSILIEAAVERRWLRPQELVGSIVVVTGIALLVGLGRPGASGEFRSAGKAIGVLALTAVVGAGALYRSHRVPRGRRTALVLGASAGVCFALDAVFLRAVAASLSPLDRPVVLLNGIGFGVASLLGNIIVARGYQSAPLRHVLPGMAAAEPVTAYLCGRLVFGEPLAGGPVSELAVAVGLILMVIGVVLCALGSAHRREATSAASLAHTSAPGLPRVSDPRIVADPPNRP